MLSDRSQPTALELQLALSSPPPCPLPPPFLTDQKIKPRLLGEGRPGVGWGLLTWVWPGCPDTAAHSLHTDSPLKTCPGFQPAPPTLGQGRRVLSILRRRQAPPGMLQTELLSLVCHQDKCGLPSGCLSPSSTTTLSGNVSLPLKGKD